MKNEFVRSLHQVLANDPKAMLLTGDLGYNAFEKIMGEFPARFVNMGAAEQNMMSVAAGLALEGFHPWAYSIAPFATYRCLEQIRNDICLHNLPVHIVGNGGGYTYGIMGTSHHTLEDMAVLKALPNITLYFPGTNNQVPAAMAQIAELSGPSYLRLGFSGFPANPNPISENPTTLTRCYWQASDSRKAASRVVPQVIIIGIGQAVQVALKAAEGNWSAWRDHQDFDPSAVEIWGISKFPFDLNADRELLASIQRAERVIVVEEHYIPGSIAESLKMQLPPQQDFQVLAPFYSLNHAYGSPQFQLRQAGVTPEAIVALITKQRV